MKYKVTLYSRKFSEVPGYGFEVINSSVEVEESNALKAFTKVIDKCMLPKQVIYATIEETDHIFREKDGQLFAKLKETEDLELKEEEKWADKPKSYEAAVEKVKVIGSSCTEDDNVAITKEEIEAFSALKKLRFLRKAWVGDWEVDVDNRPLEFWGIDFDDDDGCPCVNCYYTANSLLSFPTEEMASKFLETFNDLVMKITPLFYR